MFLRHVGGADFEGLAEASELGVHESPDQRRLGAGPSARRRIANGLPKMSGEIQGMETKFKAEEGYQQNNLRIERLMFVANDDPNDPERREDTFLLASLKVAMEKSRPGLLRWLRKTVKLPTYQSDGTEREKAIAFLDSKLWLCDRYYAATIEVAKHRYKFGIKAIAAIANMEEGLSERDPNRCVLPIPMAPYMARRIIAVFPDLQHRMDLRPTVDERASPWKMMEVIPIPDPRYPNGLPLPPEAIWFL